MQGATLLGGALAGFPLPLIGLPGLAGLRVSELLVAGEIKKGVFECLI